MRIWAKYLIVGWSIVSVGIIIVSYQVMKSDFVQEDYDITTVYKTGEKFQLQSPNGKQDEWEIVGESLFKAPNAEAYLKGQDVFDEFLTKKEFVDKMKRAKGVQISSRNKIKDKAVYLFLPLYAFGVWAIPICVFSAIGLLFSMKTESK